MNAGGITTSEAPNVSRSRAAKRLAVPLALGVVALVAAACSSGPTPVQKASTLLAAGIAAETTKSYSAAEADFNQVLQTAATNSTDAQYAYYNRGLCEQLTNLDSKAEADYQKALDINPNMTSALYNLAILVTKNDPLRAEDLYLQVVAIDPKYASAHLNLAYVYYGLGDRASAITQFRAAVKYDSSFINNVPSALKKAVTAAAAAGASGATGASTTTT